MEEEIAILKKYIENSKNTVAVTGSGISYLYGMRRLKSHTNRLDLMNRTSPKYVKKHPDEFYQLMKDSFLDATFEKGPSPIHKQLVTLEKKGKLQGIVTQNMDCLHTAAGSTNVIEIQGSFNENICMDCGERVNDYNIWSHGEMPHCPKCNGLLIPSCFYRDNIDSANRMHKAQDMISKAELVLIMGTTGFRSDEYMAELNPNTILVQINPSETIFDSQVNLNIKADAEKVFNEILSEM